MRPAAVGVAIEVKNLVTLGLLTVLDLGLGRPGPRPAAVGVATEVKNLATLGSLTIPDLGRPPLDPRPPARRHRGLLAPVPLLRNAGGQGLT
jgi:hypothetical protein